MSNKLKNGLRVTVSLVVALLIFYYLYKDIESEVFLEALKGTNTFLFATAMFIGLIGFWLRAWRWKRLIATNESITLKTSPIFWSLMFGNVVNLIFPRAGEVARCGAVRKTYPIDFGKIFGTVVLERTIDMVFMLLMMALAFIFEGRIFLEILENLVSISAIKNFISDYLFLAILLLLGTMALAFIIYLQFKKTAFIGKLLQFIRQFVSGLKTLFQMENKVGFWLATFFIWIIYFLMMYWMALSIPSTSSLSATSVLMVLVMGSIGMIAPVQGGIGTFHAMVAFILLYYGIPEAQGKVFAILAHTSQMIIVLIFGGISFLYLFRKKQETL
ncbi:lysylphosphatidylglycerol synthase transmembrane domain-containing protein [Cyclobacterium sp. 1_MG-2023]|uniref:lysylphosphatidylglycerol synthase transmembrane domain-containing protein n=1 Tax=Cyclobacterium sp. 1_MG-2023 TaxID=3062681 RepID=UPI0026E184BE|nr:lysylphosphatidylglycerol synthase transmembrane domain-containing protein [Cyclobacterium sp. 1_MG-2023]MDO6439823.1 lysylphosphatidylglycerol synthase transmembrane domain-containing protein [Cyclobacterium sp. 1_MG-2023]